MSNKYLILLIFPLLFSCEKIMFDKNLSSINPQENFDYLWTECDEKYSYFEVKNIDWNNVYDKYSTSIYDGMSDDSLFNVLGAMLRELKDDHISFFDVEKLGPDNFDWRIIKDNYLSKNYYVSGPFAHDFIANNQVGYIRFSAFTGTVDSTNLDFIFNKYKNTKGLILDLRENGGGAVSDIFTLLSRFVEEKTLVNYSRIKTGPAHNDFSEDEPVYVSPSENIRFTKKVMVLTDRSTFSAGSFFSLATKALPNLVLVGDTTGGGLGLPNGGQLPNGWTYRFSITQALDLNKDNSFENGVPPDIHVLFDWNDRTKDEVIERALLEIL